MLSKLRTYLTRKWYCTFGKRKFLDKVLEIVAHTQYPYLRLYHSKPRTDWDREGFIAIGLIKSTYGTLSVLGIHRNRLVSVNIKDLVFDLDYMLAELEKMAEWVTSDESARILGGLQQLDQFPMSGKLFFKPDGKPARGIHRSWWSSRARPSLPFFTIVHCLWVYYEYGIVTSDAWLPHELSVGHSNGDSPDTYHPLVTPQEI